MAKTTLRAESVRDNSIAPDAHTFDPAAWLSAFANRGGGWTTRPGGETILGILVCGNPDETEARAMLDGLSPEQSSQIAAYIRERGLLSAQTPDAAILHAWERRKSSIASKPTSTNGTTSKALKTDPQAKARVGVPEK